MKRIMILGAGIYQVPLIQKAKEMGLETIVVSIPGNYPGFAFADKVYKLDTRDQEAVLRAAQSEKIDGICTSGTDVAVVTIGYVCEKLGLRGISYKAARTVTDKARMKAAFAARGVAGAKFYTAASLEEAKAAAGNLGYPVVIKRVDSSGSRGITLVSEEQGIEKAYEDAMRGSRCPYVLVEECLTGTEIGVDGFVRDGKLVFLEPHEKFVFQGEKITVPMGHGFPYRGSEVQRREIKRQIQLAVEATGMDQCPVNADVFVKGEKAWVIEVGGRTGATCIPELIERHCGFNFYEKMIRNALGEDVQFEQKGHKPCMAKLLMSPVSGKITAVCEKNLEKIRTAGTEVALDYAVGDDVTAMANGTDRIGHVIAQVNSESELDNILEEVQRCVAVNGKTLEELWEESKTISYCI